MELLSIFDAYDRKARVLPSLIVLLPVLCTTFLSFPQVEHSPIFIAGSGVVSVALIYFFSHVVRSLGAIAEPALWESWGGPPSTRMVRWRDRTLADATKVQLRLAVEAHCGIRLPSMDVEAANPGTADQFINDAFRQVREFLRLSDEEGLWQKHNVEYGFARNLFGSRWLFIVLAVLSISVCAVAAQLNDSVSLSRCAALNAFLILMWLPFMFGILPQMVKHAADRYAERAWLTFGELILRKQFVGGSGR